MSEIVHDFGGAARAPANRYNRPDQQPGVALMSLLIAGLLLFTIIHLIPAASPATRAGLVEKLGDGPYRGLFSVAILASLVLIVFGWRAATPIGRLTLEQSTQVRAVWRCFWCLTLQIPWCVALAARRQTTRRTTVPVWADASTSFLPRTTGIAFCWIFVGWVYP